VPLDANESTFFLQPPAQSSPERPQSEVGDEAGLEDETRADVPADGPSELDEELDIQTTRVATAAWKKRQKKRGIKVSKYGIEYPALPAGVVKRLAQTFAQTSGVGNAKISPDTLKMISQASDWFFEQLGDDLQAYAKHAGRKVIDESDMLTLMRRYGTVYIWVSSGANVRPDNDRPVRRSRPSLSRKGICRGSCFKSCACRRRRRSGSAGLPSQVSRTEIEFRELHTEAYQVLFIRTRLAMSDGGFLTTIHSIIDVAMPNPYLACGQFGNALGPYAPRTAYHVKIYWAWLFLIFTSAALPIGIPLALMS